jgi:hypothetical protein
MLFAVYEHTNSMQKHIGFAVRILNILFKEGNERARYQMRFSGLMYVENVSLTFGGCCEK